MRNTIPGWDTKWESAFLKYQNDLRHAYYIRALKFAGEKRLLEIGAGSFRDMAALNKWGISCDGFDFSNKSVELARKEFPELSQKISQMNAFSSSFDNNFFDLTYHNGFWGCFPDEQILLLAKEQARITKGRMIATVHNAHNEQFTAYFKKMALTDDLYDVRFFHVDEISSLMHSVCRQVKIIPVGKGKKGGEDRLIKMGLGSPLLLSTYFKLTEKRYLETGERLLCIGEL